MKKTGFLFSVFLLSLCSCGNNKSESIREADYEDRGDYRDRERDRDDRDDRDRDRDRGDNDDRDRDRRDRDDDDDEDSWW